MASFNSSWCQIPGFGRLQAEIARSPRLQAMLDSYAGSVEPSNSISSSNVNREDAFDPAFRQHSAWPAIRDQILRSASLRDQLEQFAARGGEVVLNPGFSYSSTESNKIGLNEEAISNGQFVRAAFELAHELGHHIQPGGTGANISRAASPSEAAQMALREEGVASFNEYLVAAEMGELEDWNSGDKLWVVEVIAPFGGHDAMVADLKAKVFPGEALKVLALVDGKKVVRVV